MASVRFKLSAQFSPHYSSSHRIYIELFMLVVRLNLGIYAFSVNC